MTMIIPGQHLQCYRLRAKHGGAPGTCTASQPANSPGWTYPPSYVRKAARHRLLSDIDSLSGYERPRYIDRKSQRPTFRIVRVHTTSVKWNTQALVKSHISPRCHAPPSFRSWQVSRNKTAL